jgi:type II secretory pathway pseudopilin PulG
LTIVELMVAIAILLIAMAGALSTQMEALDLLHDSEELTTAMVDLQTVMEEVLLLQPTEIPDPDGPFAEGEPIDVLDNMGLQDEAIVAEYPTWDEGQVIPDPLEIRLRITWTSHRGDARELTLTTLRTE